MTIKIKAIEQYFFVVLFTMLSNVVLTFVSVDENSLADHSNESYQVLVLDILLLKGLPHHDIVQVCNIP